MLPQFSESRSTWDGGSVALLEEPKEPTRASRDWVEPLKCPPRFELASDDVIDEVRSRMMVRGFRWD